MTMPTYVVTYKARRVMVTTAETKWHAIQIAYSDAICRGFTADRQHYDAFPARRKKPKPLGPISKKQTVAHSPFIKGG